MKNIVSTVRNSKYSTRMRIEKVRLMTTRIRSIMMLNMKAHSLITRIWFILFCLSILYRGWIPNEQKKICNTVKMNALSNSGLDIPEVNVKSNSQSSLNTFPKSVTLPMSLDVIGMPFWLVLLINEYSTEIWQVVFLLEEKRAFLWIKSFFWVPSKWDWSLESTGISTKDSRRGVSMYWDS
jgi:hypothetical protein